MSRILAAILAALLAGCASPRLPAPIAEPVRAAPVAAPVRVADPCAKYKDPTTVARCRLFSGADGWRYVPEAGRRADLDTQLRCAALRPNPSASHIPAAPRLGPVHVALLMAGAGHHHRGRELGPARGAIGNVLREADFVKTAHRGRLSALSRGSPAPLLLIGSFWHSSLGEWNKQGTCRHAMPSGSTICGHGMSSWRPVRPAEDGPTSPSSFCSTADRRTPGCATSSRSFAAAAVAITKATP